VNASEAKAQREQLEKYLQWVENEGGFENPTQLDTLLQPAQMLRLEWLRANSIGKIMELGTCYGFVLAYCNGHIGVDWNEKSIMLAKILSPGREFVVSDARKVPFGDGSVDTVIVPDILEHLPLEDVLLVINEAIRLATWKVLITIPDADGKHAACFKHQWLCTVPVLKGILANIPYRYRVNRVAGFVLIEIDCMDDYETN